MAGTRHEFVHEFSKNMGPSFFRGPTQMVIVLLDSLVPSKEDTHKNIVMHFGVLACHRCNAQKVNKGVDIGASSIPKGERF